jgi:hypothetical protein
MRTFSFGVIPAMTGQFGSLVDGDDCAAAGAAAEKKKARTTRAGKKRLPLGLRRTPGLPPAKIFGEKY